MSTKVVPFNPVIKGSQSANQVAQELEQLIAEYASEGWKFYNFYTTETMIKGSGGCFGIGASPNVVVNVGFVVFTK